MKYVVSMGVLAGILVGSEQGPFLPVELIYEIYKHAHTINVKKDRIAKGMENGILVTSIQSAHTNYNEKYKKGKKALIDMCKLAIQAIQTLLWRELAPYQSYMENVVKSSCAHTGVEWVPTDSIQQKYFLIMDYAYYKASAFPLTIKPRRKRKRDRVSEDGYLLLYETSVAPFFQLLARIPFEKSYRAYEATSIFMAQKLLGAHFHKPLLKRELVEYDIYNFEDYLKQYIGQCTRFDDVNRHTIYNYRKFYKQWIPKIFCGGWSDITEQ